MTKYRCENFDNLYNVHVPNYQVHLNCLDIIIFDGGARSLRKPLQTKSVLDPQWCKLLTVSVARDPPNGNAVEAFRS